MISVLCACLIVIAVFASARFAAHGMFYMVPICTVVSAVAGYTMVMAGFR